jgi:hypothetical protein
METSTGRKRKPTAKLVENADPLLHAKRRRPAVLHSTEDAMQDKEDSLPKLSDDEEERRPTTTTSSQTSSHVETIVLSGDEKSDAESEGDLEMVDAPSEDASAELGTCYGCMSSITKP